VFSGISELLKIRRQQSAFHPNATQFTLHLGAWSIWFLASEHRPPAEYFLCQQYHLLRMQALNLSDINLIDNENWVDLISQLPCDGLMQSVAMQPYQTLWITNQVNG